MRRPKLFAVIEAAAFTVFTALMASLLYQLVTSVQSLWDAAWCLLAVIGAARARKTYEGMARPDIFSAVSQPQ